MAAPVMLSVSRQVTSSKGYAPAPGLYCIEPADEPLVVNRGECFALDADAYRLLRFLPAHESSVTRFWSRNQRQDWRAILKDLCENGLVDEITGIDQDWQNDLHRRAKIDALDQWGTWQISRKTIEIRNKMRRSRLPRDAHQHRRILIIAYGGIGDMACTIPLLSNLKAADPMCEIDVLVKKRLSALFRHLPLVDQRFDWVGQTEFFRVEGAVCGLLQHLYQRRYDAVVSAMDHFGGRCRWFLGKAIGAAVDPTFVVGTADPVSRQIPRRLWRILGLRLQRQRRAHEIDRLLELARLLGADGPSQGTIPRWRVPDDIVALPIESLLNRTSPVVGIAAFSNVSKMWPLNRVATVAKHLVERYGATVTILGSSRFHREAAYICMAAGAGVVDLTGRTPLDSLPTIVDRMDLVVSIDTGVSHLASLALRPQVVLFGSTNPRRYAPRRNPNAVVLRHASQCLSNITVEKVNCACDAALRLRAAGGG